MPEEFLTKGLQNDRYIKAFRLVNQFETAIEAILHNVGKQMIDQHPDIFESNVKGSGHSQRSKSSLFAHQRVNFPMDRVSEPGGNDFLKLNVHLYWRDPAECYRTDIDGALRAFGYKIKGLNQDTDDRIADATDEWALETAKNPWDSNTAFYNHVSNAEEIDQTVKRLTRHFAEFGPEYGFDPN